MDQQALLTAAKALQRRVADVTADARGVNSSRFSGIKAEVQEFLRQYAGEKSAFYNQAQTSVSWEISVANRLGAVISSFVNYVEAGLLADVSPVRRAQLDVVSDFLEQAQRLASDKNVHPAIPIFLIGATLEEFLRTWIEDAEVSMGNRKPGLANYATSLSAANLTAGPMQSDPVRYDRTSHSVLSGAIRWLAVGSFSALRAVLQSRTSKTSPLGLD